MDFSKISISDIVPAEYNPRIMSSEEFEKLSNSIGEFGLVDPIIINLNNNRIIGGHQRYDVLLSQGVKELNMIKLGDIGWCFTSDDLKVDSDAHEKALNIALNKISGEWDIDKLDIVLDEIDADGFDISLTGFDNLEIEKLELEGISFDEEKIKGEKDEHTGDVVDEDVVYEVILFNNPIDEKIFYDLLGELKNNDDSNRSLSYKLINYLEDELMKKEGKKYNNKYELIFETVEEKKKFKKLKDELSRRYVGGENYIINFIKEC